MGRALTQPIRLVRLYQTAKGNWRYEVDINGDIRWVSLHTRSEKSARKTFEALKAYYA